MHTKTKMVVTLGPATNTYEGIKALISAGMNVARINMSHSDHSEHKKTMDLVKKAREELKKPVAIMLDTKGPELRVGALKTDLDLKEGEQVYLGQGASTGVSIPITPDHILAEVPKGAKVLFDDGYIETEVVEAGAGALTLKVLKGGQLKAHKGINIPGVSLSLPALTEQDKLDIAFGIEQDVELIAASFIRSAGHVRAILAWMEEKGAQNTLLLAKIESAEGVANFDAILDLVDGIMVARGDLGVELPLTQVPQLQKMMIRKCYKAFKPVITATQMLETMIENSRPTRAEVSDVANAIYDFTSAVMLSGETAVGKHPLEVVRLMKETILEAEKDLGFEAFFRHESEDCHVDDSSRAIAVAAVKTSYILKSEVMVAMTRSGYCARLISRFRPAMPVLALTMQKKIYHQMAFFWGVIPHYFDTDQVEAAIEEAQSVIAEQKLSKPSGHIVITTGTPFGIQGSTNSIVLKKL